MMNKTDAEILAYLEANIDAAHRMQAHYDSLADRQFYDGKAAALAGMMYWLGLAVDEEKAAWIENPT